ncbi:DUF1338 domain-containing protein [Pseudoscourfieldia marina]
MASPSSSPSPSSLSMLLPCLRSWLSSTPSALSSLLLCSSFNQMSRDLSLDDILHSVPLDHMAFRTLSITGGVAPVIAFLESLGFTQTHETLTFASKHVAATWLRPPNFTNGNGNGGGGGGTLYYPRIFVSELNVSALPPQAAEALVRVVSGGSGQVPVLTAEMAGRCICEGLRPWPYPTKADYDAILAHSDYGAWTAAHALNLNHAAVAIHRLAREFSNASKLADALKLQHVTLSEAGGIIKTSPDGLLLQFATQADAVEVPFADGTAAVSGAYIEFAERRPLPGFRHIPSGTWDEYSHLRDGFETGSADRIFEATQAKA